MSNRQTEIIGFKSLRRDLAPHLLGPDQNGLIDLQAILNLRTDRGSLKLRPGFSVVRRLAAGDTQTPMVLLARETWGPEPVTTGAWDRVPMNDGLKRAFGTAAATTLLSTAGLDSLWPQSDGRPDFCQLGGRLFLADGLNPIAVLGQDGTLRQAGANPQEADLGLTPTTGGSLTPSRYYAYGVRRVYTDGAMEVPSVMMTGGCTLDASQNAVTVALVQDTTSLPAGWAIHYQIWRSTGDYSGALFLLHTLTTYAATWTDTLADANLDIAGESYALAETDRNYPLPPARFIRAWNGRIFTGGSVPYAAGQVSQSAAGVTLTLAGPGVVRASDRDALLRIAGVAGVFQVVSVSTVNNTWTLDRAPSGTALPASDYVLQHEDDILRYTDPLPLNIEGYPFEMEIIAGAGAGNRMTGLAVNSGNFYVLREHRVDTLEGDGDDWTTIELPDSPPGTVAHPTIADDYSPSLYYYAGASGIFEISGTKARCLSEPVRRILETEVLHEYDHLTHGVWDPVRRQYNLWLFQAGDVLTDQGAIVWQAPSLRLVWDRDREYWYRDRLPATASGIWKNAAEQPYAVIGLYGGVARLDAGTVDGASASGAVAAGAAGSLTPADPAPFTGAGAIDPRGLPLLVLDGAGIRERQTVKAWNAGAGTLEIFGAWTATPAAGEEYRLGWIEWDATPGDLEYLPAPDRTKKFGRAVVFHEPAAAGLELILSGVRAEDGNRMTELRDMTEADTQEMKGAAMGLRGRTVRLTLQGAAAPADGAAAPEIYGIHLEATDVK